MGELEHMIQVAERTRLPAIEVTVPITARTVAEVCKRLLPEYGTANTPWVEKFVTAPILGTSPASTLREYAFALGTINLLVHELENGNVHTLTREKLVAGFRSWLQDKLNRGDILRNHVDEAQANEILQHALLGKVIYHE